MKRFKNIFSKTALEPNDDLTRAKLPFGSSQVFLGLRVALLAAMLLVGVTAMAQDDPEDPQTSIQPKVKVHGSVFGGGNQADVKVNTEVNISTGQVEGNVYGGGNLGDVGTIDKTDIANYSWTGTDNNANSSGGANNTGVCNVNITGSTVLIGLAGENTTADKDHGNVFGGGKGDENSSFYCEKGMVYSTSVEITAGTVKGTVFGGGEVGRVEDNTIVEIGVAGASGDTSTPLINGDVFGAGKGLKTHGYSALVRGNPVVTVQGKTLVGGSVYGGGEIASVGKHKVKTPANANDPETPSDLPMGMPFTLANTNLGKCTVTIKDNVTITSNVFGAGQGIDDYDYDENFQRMGMEDWESFANADAYHVFLQTLALATDTHVTIEGNAHVNGSVFGGSESGFVQYDTNVTIKGGVIGTQSNNTTGNVYGGGRGLTNNTIAGRVNGNINVNILGGTITRDVYGGAALAQSNTKSTTTTGDNPTTTYPTTTVNLFGGIIGGDAYGGGLGDADTAADVGNTKVNLNGMTVGERSSAPASIQAVLANSATDGNGDADAEDTDEDYYVVSSKGCIVNQIFGCNNQNGSPQGNATVHVFATQNKDVSKTVLGAYFVSDNEIDETLKDADATVDGLKAILADQIKVAQTIGVTTTTYETLYENGGATTAQLKDAIPLLTKAITDAADTDAKKAAINALRYDVKAVYGGGNEAAYVPATPYKPTAAPTGSKSQVIIDGCEFTSIETVYGGGNAASVPEANVMINAAYEIETVFGGGNGKEPTLHYDPNPGADIGIYKNASNENVEYGTGNANTLITGGYIHEAYGGSNEKGTIMGSVNLLADAGTACDMLVKKMVSAGKNADIMGDAITVLGCMPDSWVEEYYGGADDASVHGNVELTITSGNFRKVFGGNNKGGIIMGHIKVNIEETGCIPINIDELYLGGNDAAYSVYGYYLEKNGNEPVLTNGKLTFKPRESETDTHLAVTSFTGTTYTEQAISEGQTYRFKYDAQPELNIISCTHIGEVFGGGYGTGAVMYANPTVNINMIKGRYYSNISATDDNPNQLGEIGTVYGGGNAADVIGDPTVNIGTESTVDMVSTDATGVSVVGAYITGNVFGGGKGEANTFLCEKAMIGKDGAGAIDADDDGELDTEGGTAVNIYKGLVRGNVYGGGMVGRVEKNTVVTIGNGNGSASGTPNPIILGSVFGGGKGEEEHGYAALVRGNPTVTIQGDARVRHSVYGGGEIASVARYNVPRSEDAVQAAIAEGYDAVLGMPYALKDPNSGTCTVTVRGYAEIGPETAMQMTKEGGPDDTGYVFGAGKGILPGGDYEFEQGATKRMVLYDAKDHTSGTQGTKWQWVDYPNHSESNNNVWEYFADIEEYIRFIQTLALSSRTYVTITDNAFVKGSVYGGSENGIVQFNTDVKIQGGQIGCGKDETEAHPDDYWTSYSEDPTKFAECSSWLFQEPYDSYDPYAKYKKEADGKYYYNSDYTQDAAGGAVVATDGHTYYGNVFGGGSGSIPYFDHTQGRSVYLHSAGQVKGNTNVTISGGHILTNVYGGCEATNVEGTANVTMTGGTVGIPRADEDIIAHPLTGYLFGGGKGDQRVFFNKDTNVKDAVVTVEGGRIYGSVYGGGEDGHVLRNVTLTIGKQTTTTGENNEVVTTTSGPKIGTRGTSYYDGHVFGGGRGFGGDALTAGNVGGSVDVNILDGDILGSVYGGGRLASVGYGLYLTTETGYGEMRADNEYDGSYTNPSTDPAGTFFTKGRGHITMTISGGTIGNDDEYAYNANNQLTHTKGGNVFAGGMGRMYKLDGTTPISSLDWWKLGCAKSTKLTITGGTIKSNVYGGGELGQVVGYHTVKDAADNDVKVSTEISISGSSTTIGTEVKESVTTPASGETPASTSQVTRYTFGSVFGGGYGSLEEKLTHNEDTDDEFVSYPKYIAGRVKAGTKVKMTAGRVWASVYGGGEMAAVGESKVLDETLTTDFTGDTHVIIGGGYIGKEKVGTTYFGGAKMGNVYGGGSGHSNTVRSGHVYGNTNVTISDGTIYHNVYGGGAYGTVGDFIYTTAEESGVQKVSGITGLNTDHTGTGVATVTITGGTIGYDGKENGMVFGSSRGDINAPGKRDDHTAWVYDTHVTIGTSGSNSGPQIRGTVYGSGENGHVFNDTEVNVNSGTIGIYNDTDHTYDITFNDKTYNGADYPYRGNVYGGGCGTDKYYSDPADEIHDGNGQLYNSLAGIVYGNTTVNITGGRVVRNVYGAGAMGSVGKVVSTTTNNVTTTTITSGGLTTINISGGQVGDDGVDDGNVYGAARGDATTDQTDVALVKNTSVNISSDGTVKGSVYGGGETGDVMENTEVNVGVEKQTSGTTVTYVVASGNPTIGGNVYGGGKGIANSFTCSKAMVGVEGDGVTGAGTTASPYVLQDGGTTVRIYNGTVGTEVQTVDEETNETVTTLRGGNIYGGGEIARVERNTIVEIGAATGSSAPVIKGSVFGAGAGVETHGYSALVRGTSTVTVQGGAKVWKNVYGGGELASVGRYWVAASQTEADAHYVSIGMPYGLKAGGTSSVIIQGSAIIGTEGNENTGHVYGAGQGIEPKDYDYATGTNGVNDYKIDEHKPKRWVGDGYVWFADKPAYLKYLETLALSAATDVIVGGGTVRGSVFGGSESGFVYRNTDVKIQDGIVNGDAFGGGRGLASFAEAGRVSGNTKVAISGGVVEGNVYGGGNLGDVGTIDKTTQTNYNYIWKNSESNGSNMTSSEYNNTPNNNTITGTNTNTGICTVSISGGTIGLASTDKPKDHGNVFGAGRGLANTFWCEKAIAFATNVSVSGSTTVVNGNVYGGGEVGRVEDDSKVIIGTEDGTDEPDIKGSVYGAGAGLETHGYSALVRGNSIVTVQGSSKVGGNVYGGGEIASLGKFKLDDNKLPKEPDGGGSSTVTITDNAKIGSNGTDNDVYGAGQGVVPNWVYQEYTSTTPYTTRITNSKRMVTYTSSTAHPEGKQYKEWDYYDDDHAYVWEYYPTEDAYQAYLKTLAIASHPIVTIAENATVYGDVYGGGQRGITLGDVAVNITGGTVKQDVYGGGSLADTNKGNWDDSQGTWATGKYDGTATKYKTIVALTGGEIDGNVYGGGLGQIARAASAGSPAQGTEGEEGYVPAVPAVTKLDEVKAKVYGDVLVTLNKPTTSGTTPTYGNCVVKSNIFGCNNQNGSPQSAVTVHVYKTEGWDGHMRTGKGLTGNALATALNDPDDTHHSYELNGVYGGGNLSAFYPDLEATRDTAQAFVIIDGCDQTSIKQVYGGGNAASIPATNITINASYEIEEVFGGGNGRDDITIHGQTMTNPGANVGYEAYPISYDIPASSKEERTAKFSYGSGKSSVTIYDGLIHRVFGGSNKKGNVRESAVTLLDDQNGCHFQVDEAYGGGKNAPMDAEAKLLMACIPGLKVAYGGAQEADVLGGVTLTITNGTYERVFGGNNISGTIQGPIVVNIEETGCRPVIIGELYGGGNRAGYSVYGYESDRTLKESGTKLYDDPQVNVKSFTSIGTIYGGGYGETAVMVGDPTVNINVFKGKYVESNDNVIGENAKVVGSTVKYSGDSYATGFPIPSHAKGAIGAIGTIFGGGNAAEVIGNPTVNIGTEAGEEVFAVIDVVTGASVAGYYTRTGEGTTESPYTYSDPLGANAVAVEGTTYYQKTVKGADIRGDVFGAGNNAKVTGNTNVQIGKKVETSTTSDPDPDPDPTPDP